MILLFNNGMLTIVHLSLKLKQFSDATLSPILHEIGHSSCCLFTYLYAICTASICRHNKNMNLFKLSTKMFICCINTILGTFKSLLPSCYKSKRSLLDFCLQNLSNVNLLVYYVYNVDLRDFLELNPSHISTSIGVDVVEWSRALDVRLSEWCCSVSMVWVQIPSREEQKFNSFKI